MHLCILLATVRLVHCQKAHSLAQNERILSECVFGDDKKQFTEYFEQSISVDCTMGDMGSKLVSLGGNPAKWSGYTVITNSNSQRSWRNSSHQRECLWSTVFSLFLSWAIQQITFWVFITWGLVSFYSARPKRARFGCNEKRFVVFMKQRNVTECVSAVLL